jgi:hypothetical protein
MHRKYISGFGLLLFFALACHNTGEADKLKKETEETHDKTMKEMGAMSKISRSIKKELERLDSLQIQAPLRDSMVHTLSRMTTAEAAMMEWMSHYEAPDDKPEAEAIAYLRDAYAKISANSKEITASMEEGKSELDKLKAKSK